jgi:hypothetical protein
LALLFHGEREFANGLPVTEPCVISSMQPRAPYRFLVHISPNYT